MAQRRRLLALIVVTLMLWPATAHAQELGVDYVLTGSTSIAQGGTTQTFTYDATNITDAPLTGIVVPDVIPAGLEVISSGATQGTFDEGARSWNVGELAAGATATLQVTVAIGSQAGGDDPPDEQPPPTTTEGEELPFTGIAPGWFALAGAVAILLGLAFINGARRRAAAHFWRRF